MRLMHFSTTVKERRELSIKWVAKCRQILEVADKIRGYSVVNNFFGSG
jgi:hypothetical protein